MSKVAATMFVAMIALSGCSSDASAVTCEAKPASVGYGLCLNVVGVGLQHTTVAEPCPNVTTRFAISKRIQPDGRNDQAILRRVIPLRPSRPLTWVALRWRPWHR